MCVECKFIVDERPFKLWKVKRWMPWSIYDKKGNQYTVRIFMF